MLEFMDENITKKIKEITDTGKKWLYRQISPLGRSTVAKAILLPKVCHILSVVPVHQKVIDQLQRKIFEFIWGGERKHPSFARNDSQVSTYEGGLNMPDINASLKSYQISWLRRAINNREMHGGYGWISCCMRRVVKLSNSSYWQGINGGRWRPTRWRMVSGRKPSSRTTNWYQLLLRRSHSGLRRCQYGIQHCFVITIGFLTHRAEGTNPLVRNFLQLWNC